MKELAGSTTQSDTTTQPTAGKADTRSTHQERNYPLVTYDLDSADSTIQSIVITNLPPYDFSEIENSFIADECFGLKIFLRDGVRKTNERRFNRNYRMLVSYTFQKNYTVEPKSEDGTGLARDLRIIFMVSFADNFPPRPAHRKYNYTVSETCRIMSHELQFFAIELQDALRQRYESSLQTGKEPDYFSFGTTSNRGGKIHDPVPAPGRVSLMQALGLSEKTAKSLFANVRKGQPDADELTLQTET